MGDVTYQRATELLEADLGDELVALGETRRVDGREMFGVASGGSFYPMAPAEAMAER